MASGAAFDFSGKRAVVTGGTRGVGAAIAGRLAAAGAAVFLNYARDDASAARTAGEIAAAGGEATPVKANLGDPAQVVDLFSRIGSTGPVDVLVHAAALGSFKATVDVRANQWDLTMSVNARALLLCAQQAAPLMAGRGGRMLAISSLGSGRVIPQYGAIGAAKAALEALVRYLAVELAAHRIGVNALAPGLLDTPSIRRHPQHAALAAAALARTPSGRLATLDDVADVALFLCSPLADQIVGQTLVLDGGASLLA